MLGAAIHDRSEQPVNQAAVEGELRQWVEAVTKGDIVGWSKISGGNRCWSWSVDCRTSSAEPTKLYLRFQPPRPPSVEPYTVSREADIYRMIDGTGVPAPQLIAVHPTLPVILTERAPGRADYRSLSDPAEKMAIALDFVEALVKLHALGPDMSAITTADAHSMDDCVRAEVAIWQAMYEEVGQRDALIEFALGWLRDNVPETGFAPILVHGDAGPGNFLFEDGRMTALLDWELSHPGDPMEDLAWFSMRSVMEPVPDFRRCLEVYERLSGTPLDLRRIHYHRIFVSTRVVIIRHRNVTGEPGNSIVSRSLNRRLLIDAMAAASGISLSRHAQVSAPDTEQTLFFDAVLEDLQASIEGINASHRVVSAVKNAAKVMKYLREVDRLKDVIRDADRAAVRSLLGTAEDPDEGTLCDALRSGRVPFSKAIEYFAARVARDAQLAALASGRLAQRSFPELPKRAKKDV